MVVLKGISLVLSMIAVAMLWKARKAARETHELHLKHIEELRRLQEWLFNQLYAMNPVVEAPDRPEVEPMNSPAMVSYEDEEIYAERDGHRSDWLSPGNTPQT